MGDSRVTVLGLARGEDLFDAFVFLDDLVLVRVGRRRSGPQGIGRLLLLLLTWVAVVYARVGVKRLPGATGHGLSGDDEEISRERLRLAGLPLEDLALRHRLNVRIPLTGLAAREIEGGDAPLVEIDGPFLKEPVILEATGDPPRRLLHALKERGAMVE